VRRSLCSPLLHVCVEERVRVRRSLCSPLLHVCVEERVRVRRSGGLVHRL